MKCAIKRSQKAPNKGLPMQRKLTRRWIHQNIARCTYNNPADAMLRITVDEASEIQVLPSEQERAQHEFRITLVAGVLKQH